MNASEQRSADAVEEIKQLKSRCFHGIAEKDWEMLEATLAPWSMYHCLDYGDEVFQGDGYYHEEYRRVSREWKIARLKPTRLRVSWS